MQNFRVITSYILTYKALKDKTKITIPVALSLYWSFFIPIFPFLFCNLKKKKKSRFIYRLASAAVRLIFKESPTDCHPNIVYKLLLPLHARQLQNQLIHLQWRIPPDICNIHCITYVLTYLPMHHEAKVAYDIILEKSLFKRANISDNKKDKS